jgi:hypothetical protein
VWGLGLQRQPEGDQLTVGARREAGAGDYDQGIHPPRIHDMSHYRAFEGEDEWFGRQSLRFPCNRQFGHIALVRTNSVGSPDPQNRPSISNRRCPPIEIDLLIPAISFVILKQLRSIPFDTLYTLG